MTKFDIFQVKNRRLCLTNRNLVHGPITEEGFRMSYFQRVTLSYSTATTAYYCNYSMTSDSTVTVL